MLRNYLLTLALFTLLGCASDIQPLKAQIAALQTNQNELKNEISNLKTDVESIKNQKVIRVPIGAPTETEARSSLSDSPQGTVTAHSNNQELTDFQKANQLYKSGDIKSAITAFEAFNNNYPNSSYLPQVLYNLAEASYTQRDYERAKQILEQQIYNSFTTPNPKAVNLLQQIYKTENNVSAKKELDTFLQKNN